MKQEMVNKIYEKCKTKKDGLYSVAGNKYVCVNNQVVAYADDYGNISQCVCGFSVSSGRVEDHKIGDALRSLMKQAKANK